MESIAQLLSQWFQGWAVYSGDPATIAKVLVCLGTVTTGVQAAKKLLERVDSFLWIRKFLPKSIEPAFDAVVGLAHGYGPIVINLVLTLATTGTLVLEDGTLTGGDIWTVLVAAGASDLLYKLLRNFVFTKEPAVVTSVELRGSTFEEILDRYPNIPTSSGR